MKSLKPSLREKKRYLVVEGKTSDIKKSILEGIGVIGMSKTSLKIIDSEKEKVVISINRESVNEVRACFSIFPEEIKVNLISGTLKKLRKK